MPAHNLKQQARTVGVAVLLVLLCAVVASAATYVQTTLKELSTRSIAVAEVEVIEKRFPALEAGQTFPRTHVEVSVRRSLKGALPERFVLDTPGGIVGDIASYVPDGPDFRVGERAMVFIKEPAPGKFMVQDLGLGKFNIVEREGKRFVESPLCPRAMAPAAADPEASLLTKSIPYDDFCALVTSYVASVEPQKDAAVLAAALPYSTAHAHAVPAVAADALNRKEQGLRGTWLLSALAFASLALAAALLVRYRRRHASAPIKNTSVMILLGASLLAGAGMGKGASAFVQFAQKTSWTLSSDLAGRVANKRIIWRQSTVVSSSNASCFDGVQAAFNAWEAVDRSTLAFTLGGSTTVSVNSSQDTENVMAWSKTPSNDFSNSTLAITFSSFSVSDTNNPSSFRNGDIIYNDRDFQWPTSRVLSVSLHEIGHFVGLGHTTEDKTVMFPFDGGLQILSSDEIAAAQVIYPGTADPVVPPPSGTPPPPPPPKGTTPLAVANAQSTEFPTVPVTVNFDGIGSTPSEAGVPLGTFDWDFGDGSEDSGAQVSHTYTSPGTYTVTLTVTDNNGESANDTVEINIGATAAAAKGGFKLNFKTEGKDSFTATLVSSKLVGLRAPKGSGLTREGYVNIGDQSWRFSFDFTKLKSFNKSGPKITVKDKNPGLITFTLKSADLRDVLDGHGAVNNTFEGVVNVPVTLWLGEGANIFIFGKVPFQYKSVEDKKGAGKFVP